MELRGAIRDSIPLLAEFLKGQDSEVRALTVTALVQLVEYREFKPPHAKTRLISTSAEVREAIPAIISLLVDLLKDQASNTRYVTVSAFATLAAYG